MFNIVMREYVLFRTLKIDLNELVQLDQEF